jgi:hypothetical protein
MEFNKIILGITPTTAQIFDEEFPELKKINMEPYNIAYSKWLPLNLKLFLEIPRILGVINKEHQQLKQIIKEQNIDVVISDNRFGLYSNDAHCIYLTHQLSVQAGLFSQIATKIHHHYIKNFHQVWIPDFDKDLDCLAGKLSRSSDIKDKTYIGPLSRLPKSEAIKEHFDYLCLLSGPEPLRSELEALLIEKAKKYAGNICLVRGTVTEQRPVPKNIRMYDLPTAAELAALIQSSNTVISRSGYSTLMDLHHLGKYDAILIPTPGQSEQIYLARYWGEKFDARIIQQADLKSFSY